MTTSIRLSAFVLGALASTACATMMHGSRQDVSIASAPSGASVTINGQDRGKTPAAVELPRKDKLDKAGKGRELPIRDRFLSLTMSQWETQNRTRQWDAHSQAIREHTARGIAVHLFVRRASKADGRSAPFVYCGEVRIRAGRASGV